MLKYRVALASCTEAATAAPNAHIEMQALVHSLRKCNVSASVVPWDCTVTLWQQYDAVILCQTWDYIDKINEFNAWTSEITQISALLNSAAIVKWNLNKTYLKDLEQEGIPIVPTEYLSASSLTVQTIDHFQSQKGQIVIKPSIGCDASSIETFESFTPMALTHVNSLLNMGQERVLLQPFLSSISTVGELSLIYLQGRFSHAVRKYPKAGDFRVQER